MLNSSQTRCSTKCLKDSIDFLLEGEFLQVEAGIVLELPDKKARGFLVPIALNRLFPEHARKVFGEMSVRI
jgi:hypothetical protein